MEQYRAKSAELLGPRLSEYLPEQYQEASNGQRFIQYFDKARMEQTTAGGAVTNGLLTVELITGQRQFGDNLFTTYPPATIPVVGDPINTFPTYASLSASVFPNKVAQSAQPIGTVYGPSGTLTTDSTRAAVPGAAFGSYQSDPGGKYGHNIPLAFWSYLTALPVPWQTTMGFPLTEPFWVQVTVNNVPATWVLVQPFERRVLSYTPSNPAGFQVEMGNIGQHYFQWRYTTAPGGVAGPATPTPIPTVIAATVDPCATATPLPTPTGTPSIYTPTPTSTPFACTSATATENTAVGVDIENVRQTALTDTTFGISFNTNLAGDLVYPLRHDERQLHQQRRHRDNSDTDPRHHADGPHTEHGLLLHDPRDLGRGRDQPPGGLLHHLAEYDRCGYCNADKHAVPPTAHGTSQQLLSEHPSLLRHKGDLHAAQVRSAIRQRWPRHQSH